jgi:protein O-mannosyl-transferase
MIPIQRDPAVNAPCEGLDMGLKTSPLNTPGPPACPLEAPCWQRLPAWAQGLAIVALTVIVYLPVLLHGGWVWDDPEYILNNQLISDRVSDLLHVWLPVNRTSMEWGVNTPQYYPLTFTSFWIEHNLWGTDPTGAHDPTGYHLTNVLLHAANGVLVWRLFAALRAPWPWLVGAVFALHPLHVESAAWITERKNTLSGCFYLLAALAYLRFDDASDPTSATHKARWRWYGAAFACFVLALLSKTVTSSLPAALILAFLWQRKSMTRARLLPLLPMFVVGFALGMVTAWVERHVVGWEAFTGERNTPWLERLLVAGHVLWFYPLKLLLPAPLMFNYPRREIVPGDMADWAPLLLAVALGALLVSGWRRGWRGPFLALAFYAGTIFPAAGLVYVYPHKYSFVADHFCYLASLGVIVLTVAGLARVARTAAGRVATGLAVLLACGSLTWLQGGDYRDEEWLWQSTLARNPRSWMAHNNLAVEYWRRGAALHRRGREVAARPALALAAEHAASAIALKPDHFKAHFNRAGALLLLGRHDGATTHFTEWQHLVRAGYADQPDRLAAAPQAEVERSLGQCWLDLGDTQSAEAAFRRVLMLKEDDLTARFELAGLLRESGRADEALGHWHALRRQIPPAGTVAGAVGLRRRALTPREQLLLDTFAEAGRAVIARAVTEEEGLYQDAALRLALFHVLPPQDDLLDLPAARRLLAQVNRDRAAATPEALAVEALVLAEAGLRLDGMKYAEEALRRAEGGPEATVSRLRAVRDDCRARLAGRP